MSGRKPPDEQGAEQRVKLLKIELPFEEALKAALETAPEKQTKKRPRKRR